MKISTEQEDAYTLTARISLDADELGGFIKRSREQLAKSVTVEGFRAGKAPQHLAERQLDPAVVSRTAADLALERSFSDAAARQQWDIERTTDLKVVRNDAEGMEYTVRVHLWPVVKLGDLGAVKIERHEQEVTDADVDEALGTLRNLRATYLDKTGPAAEGDRVEVDFDATLGGVPLEGGSSRNHPLIIGGKTFIPGFEEQLIGLTPGMTKEFILQAPDDYYEPKLAGKTVAFKVTVHKVQAVLKPAADDAFAASVGSFKSLSELQTSLRQGLAREKAAKEQQRVRLAVLDAIAATSEVPVPASLAAHEVDEMIHRFGHDLQSRGLQLSMYLARLHKTEEQLRAEWKPEAERQVRMLLIVRQVARDQHISVSPGELEQALGQTVAELIKSGAVTEETVDPERIRDALAERLLRERVLDFLERRCAA